jgi:hypothetical protein
MQTAKRALLAPSVAVLLASFVACVDVSTGTGAGKGGTADSGTAPNPASNPDGGPAGVQGTGCTTNPDLGIPLCTSTTSCPSIVIDERTFPNCGWRILNGNADLQCDCNGLMCPIGTPTTCAQAATILQGQTEQTICAQLSDGRCIQPTAATSTGTGTGSGGGTPSSCDQNCAADCSGNPTCLTMCGC